MSDDPQGSDPQGGDPQGAAYAQIALVGLAEILERAGVEAPDTIPPGYDALTQGERRVLGLLWHRSQERLQDEPQPQPEPAPKEQTAPDPPDEEEATDMPIIPTRGPKTPFAQPEPDRVNLRNGKARQDYAARIDGYTGIAVTDDGGTGLSVSPDGDVAGGAMVAGDYSLRLTGRKAGAPVAIHVRLSIIADPRDLWKTLPSDEDDPYWKPDEAFGMAQGDALVVAASKRGRSHAQEGKFRDDHFAIQAKGSGGWHYLIVADGAGSASHSREGSRIACETALDTLSTLAVVDLGEPVEALLAQHSGPVAELESALAGHVRPVLAGAGRDAARAIDAEAARIGRDPQDFATTLVIAISRRIGDQWVTASFTVGDGGVAIYDAQAEAVRVLCRPDSGEFAGQTRFLSSAEFDAPEDVAQRVFVDIRPAFTVLAAMTDGITDPKFPTETVLARADAWAEFWAGDFCKAVDLRADNPDLEAQTCGWLDFWSRGNHDDRTLAVLVPYPPEDTA